MAARGTAAASKPAVSRKAPAVARSKAGKTPGRAAPARLGAVRPEAAGASAVQQAFGAGTDGALMDALLLRLAPLEPRGKRGAALRKHLLARLARAPDAAEARAVPQGAAVAANKRAKQPTDRPARRASIITVPASDAGWFEALPKIHIKQVYTDGTAESYLVRLEAGARAPAHEHPGDEECVVLEGSVRYIGGSTLKAGDYEAVRAGARHAELVSDTGALVFLRYAQPLAGYLRL